jgi:hypothetical protein
MRRNRIFDAAIGALAIATFLLFAFSTLTSAQVLDPMFPVASYTTADPINPDRLGLATPDGRFAIELMSDGCDWLAEGQPVDVYPNYAMPPALGLSAPDAGAPSCFVRVDGRMSATPCFTNTLGLCDVREESDPQ